jgi:UDP-N-acetylmuramyl pentapeptide phosphotransferase/UDP-N-acetylglucosamine-1-phosphate transferase
LQLQGGIFRPGAAPWHEATIVVRAWIVAGVSAIVGLSLMKLR